MSIRLWREWRNASKICRSRKRLNTAHTFLSVSASCLHFSKQQAHTESKNEPARPYRRSVAEFSPHWPNLAASSKRQAASGKQPVGKKAGRPNIRQDTPPCGRQLHPRRKVCGNYIPQLLYEAYRGVLKAGDKQGVCGPLDQSPLVIAQHT